MGFVREYLHYVSKARLNFIFSMLIHGLMLTGIILKTLSFKPHIAYVNMKILKNIIEKYSLNVGGFIGIRHL